MRLVCILLLIRRHAMNFVFLLQAEDAAIPRGDTEDTEVYR